MIAQWTADFVGQVHLHKLTIKAVAERAGLNPRYVSWVLNTENPSDKARRKLYHALEEMIAEKSGGGV